MAFTLECTKCHRQAYGMDAFGPIPVGALKIQGFAPVLCVDCAAPGPAERPFIVRHTVTEKDFTIKAYDAADAINRHLAEVQLQAGKILDVGLLRIHLDKLEVQGPDDPKPVTAMDALLKHLLKGL